MEKSILLSGKKAKQLWLKGKEDWNNWVEKHPDANVDFSNVDFTVFEPVDIEYDSLNEFEDDEDEELIAPSVTKSGEELVVIDFMGYKFPNGKVSFEGVNFKGLQVSFSGAKFGSGNIIFSDAVFDSGRPDFTYVDFGDGDLYFEETSFGPFGVDFTEAVFPKGDVWFRGTQFNGGKAIFFRTDFSKSQITFKDSVFRNDQIIFDDSIFSQSNLVFSNIKFGDGSLSFDGAEFKSNFVRFVRVQLAKTSSTFRRAKFKGDLEFINLVASSEVRFLSFSFAVFNKALNLQNCILGCVVDLNGTKLDHHMSLQGLVCQYRTEPNTSMWLRCIKRLPTKTFRIGVYKCTSNIRKRYFTRASDPSDSSRFRRLKEIAQSNKHHDSALQFHAEEMRSRRFHELTSFGGLILDYLYEFISDFGRSERRPIVLLTFLWVAYGFGYSAVRTSNISLWESMFKALIFSAGQILTIIPSSKDAREFAGNSLYLKSIPDSVYSMSFSQSLLSILLIFLIGLALRNRFRI